MSVRVGRELSELQYIGRDDLRAVWILRAQRKMRISTGKSSLTGRSISGTKMPLGTAARTSDWDIMVIGRGVWMGLKAQMGLI
jgi:hypothetical protein